MWLHTFYVCMKFHFLPAVVGLKKEGAMTAIPPAPISAAWWAWRKHEDCAENTFLIRNHDEDNLSQVWENWNQAPLEGQVSIIDLSHP